MAEPASLRFKSMIDNRTLERIFDFLKEDGNIRKMIISTANERPAMEVVIEGIEKSFPMSAEFDLECNYRHRQILGSMIRFIMGHNGFRPGKAKSLRTGRFVKTAIVYHPSDELAMKSS